MSTISGPKALDECRYENKVFHSASLCGVAFIHDKHCDMPTEDGARLLFGFPACLLLPRNLQEWPGSPAALPFSFSPTFVNSATFFNLVWDQLTRSVFTNQRTERQKQGCYIRQVCLFYFLYTQQCEKGLQQPGKRFKTISLGSKCFFANKNNIRIKTKKDFTLDTMFR